MDAAEGKEEYLERLVRDLRDCVAEVEEFCRAYGDDRGKGRDAGGGMSRCAKILDDRNARHLISEVDQLLDRPETPRWSD